MKFFELHFKIVSNKSVEKARYLCHAVHAKLNKDLRIKSGVFLRGRSVVVRTYERYASDLMSISLSELFGGQLSAEPLMRWRQLPAGSRQIKAMINYREPRSSEERKRDRRSRVAISDVGRLYYRCSGKDLVGCLNYESADFPKWLLEEKRLFKTESVEYEDSSNIRKIIRIREYEIRFKNSEVTDIEKFLTLAVEGIGTRKSYGCGLIEWD